MASTGSVPTADADLGAYMSHFSSKLPKYSATLAISADDLNTLQADTAMILWTLQVLPSLRAAAQQFTAFKDDLFDGETGGAAKAAPAAPVFPAAPVPVANGAIPRTRSLIQRIKKSPGYTEAIGKDLGIIAPETQADTQAKPKFAGVALTGSQVRLDWVKGRYDGVIVQCRRTGDADFITLGRDNYSPYVDGRPPVTAGASETRQYRMRYIHKDDEVGDWSDIVSVVTLP